LVTELSLPRPTSEEDVANIVRDSASAGRAIAVFGAGTKRHHGPAGVPGAMALSLARLDRITSYEPGDLVVTVQAGVRLADLQVALARNDQWLPLDPPYASATIGGILATGSSGPRRLGYGTAKDMLLGLRVCGGSGIITKSGGRVVKNVTGYDLHKLQVGAFGSLGVLLEANFKVQPRPQVSAAFVYGCPDLATAHRLLLDVRASSLRPVALEALDAEGASALRGVSPELPAGALAVVAVEGTRLAFERHRRDLAALASSATASLVLEGTAAERLWNGFRDAPGVMKELVTVRVGARPHDLPPLLAEIAKGAAGSPAIHSMSVQAGTGIARIRLQEASEAAAVTSAVDRWHCRAAGQSGNDGYAVVESAPVGLAGREALPWMRATATLRALGQSVKKVWDPSDIINPGRMSL
jgi:glycolate oxidase FAD binding subunit